MATLSGLQAEIRAATDHDSDTQVTDAQLLVWINIEYYRLRRQLAEIAPTLYLNSVTFSLTSTNVYTISASDYDKIYRVERLNTASTYDPLMVANALDPEVLTDGAGWAFLEAGSTLVVYPSTNYTGSYRLWYTTKPTALSGASDAVVVPNGAEEIIAQRVAARVRVRFEEDPSPHMAMAGEALAEVKSYMQNRYGVHPMPMRMERRY